MQGLRHQTSCYDKGEQNRSTGTWKGIFGCQGVSQRTTQ